MNLANNSLKKFYSSLKYFKSSVWLLFFFQICKQIRFTRVLWLVWTNCYPVGLAWFALRVLLLNLLHTNMRNQIPWLLSMHELLGHNLLVMSMTINSWVMKKAWPHLFHGEKIELYKCLGSILGSSVILSIFWSFLFRESGRSWNSVHVFSVPPSGGCELKMGHAFISLDRTAWSNNCG